MEIIAVMLRVFNSLLLLRIHTLDKLTDLEPTSGAQGLTEDAIDILGPQDAFSPATGEWGGFQSFPSCAVYQHRNIRRWMKIASQKTVFH